MMSVVNDNNTVSSPSYEDLFKQPPPLEDCPICFLRLPTLYTGRRYKSCCGKDICSGCIHAPVYDNNGNKLEKKCPFCRSLTPFSHEEVVDQLKKRIEVGDARAMYNLGGYYSDGIGGFPQDRAKALELWHRAAELGYVHSYYNIGFAYHNGRAVARDETKATHYWELAAIGGNAEARYNIGSIEVQALAGNMDRALKHFMIAVEGGYNESLNTIQRMYSNGYATRDDYANALRAYQAYLEEIKSDQRDKAFAFDEMYKYYE